MACGRRAAVAARARRVWFGRCDRVCILRGAHGLLVYFGSVHRPRRVVGVVSEYHLHRHRLLRLVARLRYSDMAADIIRGTLTILIITIVAGAIAYAGDRVVIKSVANGSRFLECVRATHQPSSPSVRAW